VDRSPWLGWRVRHPGKSGGAECPGSGAVVLGAGMRHPCQECHGPNGGTLLSPRRGAIEFVWSVRATVAEEEGMERA